MSRIITEKFVCREQNGASSIGSSPARAHRETGSKNEHAADQVLLHTTKLACSRSSAKEVSSHTSRSAGVVPEMAGEPATRISHDGLLVTCGGENMLTE